MKKKTAANEGNLATNAEIEAVIENLTPLELVKLRDYAKLKVAKLGRKARELTWEDLLNDAYLSALCGNRKWDKSQVDFVGFLIGAMRSIAFNHRAKFERVEESLELGEDSRLAEISLESKNRDGEVEVMQIASLDLDPENDLLAREKRRNDKEQIQAILSMAEEREFAPYIILEWLEEKSGPDIQRSLNITQTQYETEMKWIRRNARKTLQI